MPVVSTTNITGNITLPNDTVPAKSSIIFTLSQFDIDDTSDAVVLNRPIVAQIADDGSIDVDLWSNINGELSTVYKVSASVYNGSSDILIDIGRIEVPATGGPYNLDDLLQLPAPTTTPIEDFIALKVATEVAAAQAAAYDGPRFDTLDEFLADQGLTFDTGNPGTVSEGDYVRIGNQSYQVAADGAGDGHYSNDRSGADPTENDVELYEAGPNFSSRARMADAWARMTARGETPPDGTVWSDGTVSYVYDGTTTAISDMSGWAPFGDVYPDHFDENTTPGTTDMSAAVQDFISYHVANGTSPNWPDSIYLVSGNITSLLSYLHTGRGRVVSGSDTFYIGDQWDGSQNVIYCSPSGSSTNDGITSSTPLDFTTAFNNLRGQAKTAKNIKWKLQFAAGTYPDGPSRRFEEFPHTTFPVEFVGPDVSGGVPTAIFSGWSDAPFKKLKGTAGQNLYFSDLKFENCSGGGILIRHGAYVETYNIHGDGCSIVLELREVGNAIVRGGVIENSDDGIHIQDCYGTIGGTSVSDTDGAITFNNITNSGYGCAIEISRGSKAYVRICTFGDVTANDVNIRQSRISRVRTQSNIFHPANTASFVQEGAGCIWNDDPANLDTLTGFALGAPFVLSSPGSYISTVHNGLFAGGHRFWNGTDDDGNHITLSGTSRTLQNTQYLSPFRMPEWWLLSPNARGIFHLQLYTPVAETVTVELSGVSSSTSYRTGHMDFATTGATRLHVEIEFTGPIRGAGGTRGTFIARGYADNGGVQINLGETGDLSNSSLSGSSASDLVHRLYLTRSVGTGDMEMRHMASYVSL